MLKAGFSPGLTNEVGANHNSNRNLALTSAHFIA